MLVLSRKVSDSLTIGDGIKITVLKIERNQVRIGIEAPGNVVVLRSELLEREHDDSDASRPIRQSK